MRRMLIGLVTAALLTLPPGSLRVDAQSVPEIDSLEISFWPEFDQRSVLVIYKVSLSEDTSLPATVRVPIPPEVEEPHAVAVVSDTGSLLLAPHVVDIQDGRAAVVLESSSLEVQVEFYMDLEIVGASRSYTFEWPGGVKVGSLAYEVQAPLGASELSLTPVEQESYIGIYGLTYFRAELGPQDVVSTPTIEMSYQKTISALTVEQLQSVPALDRPDEIEGSTSDLMSLLPWILLGFSVVLLVVEGIYILQLRNELSFKGRRSRRRSPKKPKPANSVAEASIFCHQCGQGGSRDDLFCRQCGERLRQ